MSAVTEVARRLTRFSRLSDEINHEDIWESLYASMEVAYRLDGSHCYVWWSCMDGDNPEVEDCADDPIDFDHPDIPVEALQAAHRHFRNRNAA